jgi:hypothetical protein
MKTFIERIDTEWGAGWGVVEADDDCGELIEFRTRRNATEFRKSISKLEGNTLQAKFDTYTNLLIEIYQELGCTKEDAFAVVAEKHC